MNVKGLNNMGLPAPASAAGQGKALSGQAKTSASKDKSAFDTLMTRVQGEKAQAKNDKPLPLKKEDSKQAPQEKPQAAPARPRPLAKDEPRAPQRALNKDPRAPQSTAEPRSQSLPAKNEAMPARLDGPGLRDKLTERNEPVANEADGELSAEGDFEAEGLDADGLPTPSGFPSLNGPGLTDRALQAPATPGVAAPGTKQNAPMGEDAQANTLTRRVVWNDFLRKMSGLGISVEDVMGAFGSLSEKELAMPPEQTVDRVVAALGLNDQQTTLARQYFGELINKTQSKTMGEELSASSKQISLSLMSQREMQRKQLSRGIENLERDFFMQPTPEQSAKGLQARDLRNMEEQARLQDKGGREAMLAAAGQSAPAEAASQAFPESNHFGLASGNKDALAQSFVNNARSAAQGPQAMNPQEMNALIEDMQNVAPEDKRAVAELVKNFTRGQELGAQGAMPVMPATGGTASATTSAQAAASAPREALAQLSALLSGGKDDAGDDSGEQNLDSGSLGQMPVNGDRMAGAIGRSEFQGQLAQALAPAQAKPVTMPELIQQAQVIVKDGGGEMKVTMSPEGLGEVAMRVSVQDGKVQVQMITESDEAKKMIERSLGDLKHGLAQSNLTVDTIKIDTATNLGKQLEQQYNDAQRQAAQQNLEQFRQDHQGWRRSFFETPTVRNYQSQSNAPTDVGNGRTNSSSRRAPGSRRLDLVA